MTTSVKTLSQLANHQEFIARHIGPDAETDPGHAGRIRSEQC